MGRAVGRNGRQSSHSQNGPWQPENRFVNGMELQPGSESDRRLALANWITDPKNPLTARVIVNRIWYYHFGTGIVNTPSDFGANGDKPSHPELLDWLATSYVEHGWSIKWLHRLILSSQAYQ